ncbi:MAG: NrtR DNA-binding winged helix domain-containing protein [Sphingomonas sp.]|uniref:NrtR DNA-binding winged helix domain-containing protein n=1 Tax=Sphingomonas sp. TaxID=28214 RepID=UPI003F811CEB
MTERRDTPDSPTATAGRFLVTVQIVVFASREGKLNTLLSRNAAGLWGVASAQLEKSEQLDDAAARAMRVRFGPSALLRQIGAFNGVDRDQVRIGYMTATSAQNVDCSLSEQDQFASLDDRGARWANGSKVRLAPGVSELLRRALSELRLHLDLTEFVFRFLPPEFSLRELQHVHEAVRGQSLNKPAFRKRLLQSGWLEPTGELETGKGFRPAELYRVRRNAHGRMPA